MVSQSNQKKMLEKAYRDICITLVETESNVMMFNKMIRKRVPTNDVRSFALKQAALCRVHKNVNSKIERVVMKIKRADALAYIKRLRQDKHRAKTSLLQAHETEEDARKIIH